ncbi:hypothetical protein A2755_03005 [Candidatus Wolfebacteria bacterium RIFCSPHIGHO2_01_FULL_48_22]|uniref:Uncharacterized protein n=1 Tax=Candidatus Wolfebacteria bacterium RIFCSPHIGHO2_01_FULL_48_22 TaxID=1802555 RepID=A0A1F8DR51_9BACT|nr:MAG: hypothetical protein A2755_03005 [Candidatus Wolfebacteria bacterium RIFCSPHIGHO2_01_FULL_48_22]
MSDKEKLNKARALFERGEYSEARRLLEEITTKEPTVRLNVLSALIGVLDHVTENDKLLAVANEGIEVATRTGNDEMRSYFLGKRSFFLLSELSSMIYRQSNLMLSARVFPWIEFSLKKDKDEYETLSKRRVELEQEIESAIEAVAKGAEQSTDHNFKGHQFSSIGDAYSTKYLVDKLDYQEGGKIKSKIANLYVVRRWNLDHYLYRPEVRRKIDASRDRCIAYFEKSIKEFELAGQKSEQAHSIYNLAAKTLLFNNFRRTRRLLVEARAMAESIGEKRLLKKIEYLEKRVAGENEMRDYVNEMGLDMPEGRHPSL